MSLDGLMSRKNQVKFIKGLRSEEQISSFWKKYPQHNEGGINGLCFDDAAIFAPGCPYLYTEFKGGFKLSLWVDIDEMCFAIMPSEVKQSIKDMAEFQCWVHKTPSKKLRDHVCKMIASAL